MLIEIKRSRFSPYGVDGTLWIDGAYVCDTVEHPQHYLYGGTHGLKLLKNKTWQRHLPTMPKGATICPANGAFALKRGSIAVGKRVMPGVLLQTNEVLTLLCNRIRKCVQRGGKVALKYVL